MSGTTTMSCLLAAAVLCAAFAAPTAAAQAKSDGPKPALSSRAIDKLVARYFEVEGRSAEGLRERAELRARLRAGAPAEFLKGRKYESFIKKIDKLWKKGPKLAKSGDNFFWEKERRGRYIIGGRSKRPKGLAICMHGGGAGSGDAGAARGSYDSAISAQGWLGIYPEVLKKTECGWTDSGTEEWVLELVDRALRTWKIDRDQVYFVGHSMGGYGSWTLGAHHADRVAALAPSAGAPTPILSSGDDSVEDIIEGVIPNLHNVPIVIFQSDDDPRVPPAVNRAAAKKLGEAQQRWGGFDFEYWEVTGRGHGAPPGGFRAQLEKIVERRRDPSPAKIVWQPTLEWKQQFYWLWWERPALNSIVVAERSESDNAVTFSLSSDADLSGLEILVPDALIGASAKEMVIVVNGNETWRGKVGRDVAAVLSTSVHGDAGLRYAGRVVVLQ